MNTKKITLIGLLTIFCLTGLLLTAARAESPDYGNSCGDAEVISPNSITNGYITKGDGCNRWGLWCDESPDRDFFKITVPDSGTLTIYTTNPASSPIFDTKGRLYDSSDCRWWDPLAVNDDAGTGNENFFISESVGPGDYYLRVAAGHWDMEGGYKLHVEFAGTNAHTITASAGGNVVG